MGTTRLFMWGYQGHFQFSVEYKLKGLLSTLGIDLPFSTFLVGKLISKRNDRYPVCVEPESELFNEGTFSELQTIELEKYAKHSKKRMYISDQEGQKSHDSQIRIAALQDAFQQVIDNTDKSTESKTYISWPTKVGDYMVSVCVTFNDSELKKHIHLSTKEISNIHFGDTAVSRSLLEGVVYAFLGECSERLSKPNPGATVFEFLFDHTEILTKAANLVMQFPEYQTARYEVTHQLLDAFNNISLLKYEGAEVLGRILIMPESHPNVETLIQFKSPIPIREMRTIRKLLETTSVELSLLLQGYNVIGIGKIKGNYDCTREDLFEIRFKKHYSWDLLHNEVILFRITDGKASLPKRKIDEIKFKDDLKRIFNGIQSEEIENIWKLTKAVDSQKHGTLLIISDAAEKECQRLGSQAIVLEPKFLNKEVIKYVSAIDGAIIIDRKSYCYAIGTILDGLASGNGDNSRGSRYNSAIRYISSTNHASMAIIVSSDGMMEYYPNLKPKIKRKSIDDNLLSLENLAKAEFLDLDEINKIMHFFSLNSFYLLESDCKIINNLESLIQSKIDKQNIGVSRFRNVGYSPNSEMSPELYYE